MTPTANDLWFLPLGGTGEIGMNMNLYGHDEAWLMVDCGVTFPRGGEPGPSVQMADPAFIKSRRESLVGIVITHAHEDHIGAVPYLWRELQAPVYATPFTAEILRRKLIEQRLEEAVPIHIMATGSEHRIGPFSLEWIDLTHSIPEPSALLIRTAAGTIFHTADWKLDPDPVVGNHFAKSRLQSLGDETIDAVVCDSTNALSDADIRSEGDLFDPLYDVVSRAKNRVIITCFGSNIARLHTIAAVAEKTGRDLGLLGRSLHNMSDAAKATGYWNAGKLVPPHHLGFLPREHSLIVATGSQGERRTALARLAWGQHPDLTLQPDDMVIFSSRVIPGNEAAVRRMVTRLEQRGVEVIQDEDQTIHASGHPYRNELRTLYQWVQPNVVIPVHGEPEHIQANSQVAGELNLPSLTGSNGDLYMIRPQTGLRRQVAETGRIGWNGRRLTSINSS